VKKGPILTNLYNETFSALCGGFSGWRIDPLIRDMEKNRDPGRILGFIRGLRLSSQLIYVIRDSLSSLSLEADWGHLVDENGNSCSPECDIVVHEPGYKKRWNGNEKPVMDFKFIDCRAAVVVISCKSFIRSVDKEYCEKMKHFVKNLWLFAECCRPGSVKRLKESTKSAGYKNFWYLYTWDGKKEISPNQAEWFDFIGTLEELKTIISKKK